MSINQNDVQKLKEQYPPGTEIRLDYMDDPFAPIQPGTMGVVNFVDGIGTLHYTFENGRYFGVIVGEDSFTVISRPEPENTMELGGINHR